jgi:hypothetical protein
MDTKLTNSYHNHTYLTLTAFAPLTGEQVEQIHIIDPKRATMLLRRARKYALEAEAWANRNARPGHPGRAVQIVRIEKDSKHFLKAEPDLLFMSYLDCDRHFNVPLGTTAAAINRGQDGGGKFQGVTVQRLSEPD